MVAIPRLRDFELTGRARVRPAWRGRLVLQVEVLTTEFSACPARPGSDPVAWRNRMRSEGEQWLHWRDARWEDMQALERLELVPAGRIEPSRPWPRGGNVNPPPAYARPPAPPGPPSMKDERFRGPARRGPGQPTCDGCPDPDRSGPCSNGTCCASRAGVHLG